MIAEELDVESQEILEVAGRVGYLDPKRVSLPTNLSECSSASHENFAAAEIVVSSRKASQLETRMNEKRRTMAPVMSMGSTLELPTP